MKAAALTYAQGDGPMPAELMLGRMIERYGTQAVLHRDYIGAGEAFAMNTAENIVNAYKSREASENWAEWAQKYPEMCQTLAGVEANNGE